MDFVISDFSLCLGDRICESTSEQEFVDTNGGGGLGCCNVIARCYISIFDLNFLDLVWHFTPLKLLCPILRRLRCRLRGVKVRHNRLRQLFFQRHGMRRAARSICLHHRDLLCPHIRQQLVIPPHHLVGDRHHFAVHLERRLVNANRVPQRLRHLVHAVEAFEDRRRQYHLRFLPVGTLQFAPDQKIEFLIGSA